MIHYHLKNILPDDFNSTLIDFFSGMSGWSIERSYVYDTSSEIDSGISLKCLKRSDVDPLRFEDRNPLMDFGTVLFFTALNKLPYTYKEPEIQRVILNYYNRSSICPKHVDIDYDNYLVEKNKGREFTSALYYMNTSKGSYTQILQDRVYGESGDMVFFDSRDEHSSTGAVEDTTRYTLNYLFTHSGMVKKNGEA